nr:MAG TPA: hypothetical protein [Caudoviricetes sp.]
MRTAKDWETGQRQSRTARNVHIERNINNLKFGYYGTKRRIY